MKLISEKELINNIIYDSAIKRGTEYYASNQLVYFHKEEFQNFDSVKATFSKYNCKLRTSNGKILFFSCECENYKKHRKLCMHLIATVLKYNSTVISDNKNLLKDLDDYKLGFIIDIFNSKAALTPVFIMYNKNYLLTNFENLKNNKLDYVINGKVESINFDDINYKIIDQIKDLFLSENKIISPFTQKVYSLSKENFLTFINYCFDKDVVLINEKDQTKIVNYKSILELDDDNNDKKTLLLNFFNKEISLKRNYNDLYIPKFDCKISDIAFSQNKNIYFISSKQDDRTIVNIVDNDSESNGIDLYWNINHGISKLEFYKVFNIIQTHFGFLNWYFNQAFIDKNNLLSQDVILSLEISYNDVVKNPILILKYLYSDKFYYAKLDDEKDVNFRKIESENKLYSKIEKYLLNFDESIPGFVFNDVEEFNKIVKWMVANKNNKNYEIKLDQNLIYKEKPKIKFSIQSIKSENDLVTAQINANGFNCEDTKKIVRAFIQKKKFVLIGEKNINLLTDIDFFDLENQLVVLNSTFEDLLNDNVVVKKWNYFLLKDKFKSNKTISKFFDDLKNLDGIKLNCNPYLQSLLKPYQIYGVRWLKVHHQQKTGSILADDMGLGKTIQSIAFVDDLFNSPQKKLALIVTPSSLIYNWKKEFAKFSSKLNTVVFDGKLDERIKIIRNIDKYDVIVISYNLLKIDLDYFKNISFDLVLVDEGHMIKNHYTKFSKSIKSLSAKHKIVLTGTPMENNVLELWSIFDFLMPGFLNDFNSFKKMINNKNENGFYDVLKTKISPFILRRTKENVLKELPPKIEKIIPINFNDEQNILYSNLLENVRSDIEKSIKEKDIEKNKVYILSLLTKLRQLCCSPKILYENAQSNGAKFDVCFNLVKEIIDRNEKVLIFSQFTSMIDILKNEFQKNGIKCSVIVGSTNKKERQNLVDYFNKNDQVKVFLISLKAGAVGLNLTSASNVIHYDMWWNISIENQASDRAHRIGQKNKVIVYKLVTNNSIEEKIVDIQNLKRNLISSVLNFDSINYENISMKEMLSILDIKKFDY